MVHLLGVMEEGAATALAVGAAAALWFVAAGLFDYVRADGGAEQAKARRRIGSVVAVAVAVWCGVQLLSEAAMRGLLG